jgi:hypothetical protein
MVKARFSMAARAYAFRRIAALLLAAAISLGAAPAPTAIVTVRGAKMVPVERLAKHLGLPVRRGRGRVQVDVDGSWIEINANDITVREDGSPMMRLTAFPRLQSGQLYVGVADLANLLDVNVMAHGNRLVIGAKDARAERAMTVSELATPTPRPSADPPRATAFSNTVAAIPQGRHLIGHASFEFMNQANSRFYQGMFDGGSGSVHASLYANGSQGTHTMVGGTVTLGTGARHADFGSFPDPLYGEIFNTGGTNGVDFENRSGTTFSWGDSPYGNRRILALSNTHGALTQIASLVSEPGSGMQLLGGLIRSTATAKGFFSQEIWIGEHGLGAGIHYRTAGRFYMENRLGIAGAGLPLIPGDAPTQLDAGYDFSSSLGLRAGIDGAKDQPLRPFAQIYAQSHGFQASFSHQLQGNVLTAGYDGTGINGFVDYGRSGSSTFLSGSWQMQMGRGLFTANAYSTSANSRDEWAEYQFNSGSAGPTLGIESVSSGDDHRFGPVVGVALPVARLLTARLELHPLARGNGLRVAVQQTLTVRNRVAQQRFITVASETPPQSQLFVLVDGVRGPALSSASVRVPVPDGNHYVSLQSEDGKLGSPETRVVDGNPAALTLPLWPVLEVRGSVRLPQSATTALLGVRPSLAGITVVIQPGTLVAQTDANGNFDFPPQGLAPDSTITVDASSLPAGLAPSTPVPVSGDAPITVQLQLSKKIEKVTF